MADTKANPLTLHDAIRELQWMQRHNARTPYNVWALDYAVQILTTLAGGTHDWSSG